jgi:hypothetical protein
MKRVGIIVVAIFSVFSGEISASTAQKLQSIIIPSIEVVEAPIGDVAGLLQSKSSELDSSGVGVNLILDVKPEALEQTVSLCLQNVTLGRAVWFLAEIAGLDLKVDRHAVILVERTGMPKPRDPEFAPDLVLKLRTIEIPSMEFQDTPLDDALQFLRDLANKNDPDPKVERRGINIVKIPRRGLDDPAVSLRLNAVPLGEAIKYTCALADYSVTIQKGAVVVYPTPVKADP